MLNFVDDLIRKILMDGVAGLRATISTTVTEDQVRFEPPDEQWSNYVNNLQRNALNVYLVDLRENRKLRSNERVRSIENGMVYETPASTRMDLHYLISAWSQEQSITPLIQPVIDEHQLLYDTIAVLVRNSPLNPSRVYPANSNPFKKWLEIWPVSVGEMDLPTAIAPVEGFPKLAEFWGTMGQNHRWKPVVYLIVTVPVELLKEFAGPMVTTRITEYRQIGRQEPGDVWIQIGGQVLDAKVDPPAPIVGAWVWIETLTGEILQTTNTDDQGNFSFSSLKAGRYRLQAKAAGLGELKKPREIDVPSPSGEYNLFFVNK